jgi:hexosaminidase
MAAVIDLGRTESISHVHTAFLKVTNHVVFFPEQVEIFYSTDSITYHKIAAKETAYPLKPRDKVNDVEYFDFQFTPVQARYVKVYARSMKEAPPWHHASGLPSWIFCDEVIIN